MATEPPRAVIDTVVYLQAALKPAGPAFAALELVDAARIRLVASEETLEEVAEVLSRPRLRAKYPDLTDERRDQLLAVIRHVAEIVSAVPRTVLLARDPDDESYLNLAVTSGARYLVTRDKDLLDLMGDAAFVAQYPGLKILSPVELLRELAPPIQVEEGKE
jgi:putative PIN family toxin of toxin-antitoxin system